MLLAAGLGTRMRPLTDHCPKPLLKVVGVPLIEHHICRLADAGFKEIVINVAYRGEQIREYLGGGERWAVQINYSNEPEALETGGGILQALPLLIDGEGAGEAPFLVVNGDIWTDVDYRSLPHQIDGQAHLLMVANPAHNLAGDFVLTQGAVKDKSSDGETLTFSGVSVLKPSLWAGQTPGKFPLAPLLRAAVDRGEVTGSRHNGYWIDVGTPERLQQLEDHLHKSDDKMGEVS